VPIYTGIQVNYQYKFTDETEIRHGTYELDADGNVISSGFNPPPFELLVSGVAGDPLTGLPPVPDPNPPFFNPAKVPSGPEDGVVKSLDELQYVRFRFVIPRTQKEGAREVTAIGIEDISFLLSQKKPGS
jgi:hypothetical protein